MRTQHPAFNSFSKTWEQDRLRMVWALLEEHAVVQQSKVNSAKQFVESHHFDDAVTGVVADSQDAREKMSDYFFANEPVRSHLMADIARRFYQVVTSDGEDASAQGVEAAVTGTAAGRFLIGSCGI